jgi:hypothetical protein
MAAPDALAERLDAGMEALPHLPEGHLLLQMFEGRYASVQLWVQRGRYEKAAGVLDAMLRGLGV